MEIKNLTTTTSLQQDNSLVSCYCLFQGTVSAYRVICSLLEHNMMAVFSSLQQDSSLVSCFCLFQGTVSAYRVMCSLLEHSVMAVLSSLQQDKTALSHAIVCVRAQCRRTG